MNPPTNKSPEKSGEKSTESCPKCGVFPLAGARECSACGLVFKKWDEKAMGGHVDGSKRLEMMWQEVLKEWENPIYHDNFVQQSNVEKNLPFASLKYRRILEVDPHNEQALKRKEQLLQLVMNSFMMEPSDKALGKKHPGVVYMLGGTGVVMMFIGFFTPEMFQSVAKPLIVIGFMCLIFSAVINRLRI